MLSVEVSPPGGWLVASGFTAAATPTFWPAAATPKIDAWSMMAEPSAAVAQNLSDVRMDPRPDLLPNIWGLMAAYDKTGRRVIGCVGSISGRQGRFKRPGQSLTGMVLTQDIKPPKLAASENSMQDCPHAS